MIFDSFGHRYNKYLFLFTRFHKTRNVFDYTKPVKVKFITQEGEEKIVTGPTGQDILTLAHENGVDLEGACEGSLACSTCHVILDKESYKKLPEPTDEENDMLDLAFGLTETSRLGCQVKLEPKLDGMTLKLPSATRNIKVERGGGDSTTQHNKK